MAISLHHLPRDAALVQFFGLGEHLGVGHHACENTALGQRSSSTPEQKHVSVIKQVVPQRHGLPTLPVAGIVQLSGAYKSECIDSLASSNRLGHIAMKTTLHSNQWLYFSCRHARPNLTAGHNNTAQHACARFRSDS